MEDRGSTLTATAVVFLVLTWLALIARGWVRVRITRRLWFDDYVLLVSMAMFNIFVGMYLMAVYWGLGKHMEDPKIKSLRNSVQAWFYGDIFYTICSATFRLAAGEQLIRHVTRKSQLWVVYTLTWINIIYNFYMVFILIFQCRPIYYFWERTVFDSPVQGMCRLNIARWSLHLQSATAAIIDIVFATMPLWIMKDLNVAHCQRNAVIAVMVLAELAGVAMGLRIPYIREMKLSRDWTWTGADLAIWSVIEPGIGILSLCLATFAPIMSYLWPTSTQKPPKGYGPKVYRRDFISESALRGIPLESGFGNIAYVESGASKANGGAKLKKKEFQSAETLPGAGDNWDISIVKTTNVVTFSDDATPKMSPPQKTFRR